MSSSLRARLTGVVIGGIWLIFLGFYVPDIARQPRPVAIGAFAIMALFVVDFLWLVSHYGPYTTPQEHRPKLLAFGLMLLCAAGTVPLIGDDALMYAPYVIGATVFSLWRPWNEILGTATAVTSVAIALARGIVVWQTGIPYGLVALVLGIVVTRMEERAINAETLRREAAVANERNRIATDVHDLLGHSLTVVKLKTQLARKVVDTDPARAKAELDDIDAIVTDALANVRMTVSQERSRNLSEELAAASETLRTAGVDLTVQGDPHEVTGPVSFVLGWVVREATTNIIRHAHATAARVDIEQGRLTIGDDGDGITPGQHGNGIMGMSERVAAAGAALTMGSSPLGGAEVKVTW